MEQSEVGLGRCLAGGKLVSGAHLADLTGLPAALPGRPARPARRNEAPSGIRIVGRHLF